MTFIHAADLHLSRAEADYGFSVLAELLSLAGGGVLLLSGDVFDDWDSLCALRLRFREAVEGASGGPTVLVAAGNHDRLRAPSDPARFDFGRRVRWAWESPLSVEVPGAEFLLLPYGAQAPAPDSFPRGALPRVVAAHGAMPLMNWLGPAEEEGGGKSANLDAAALLALQPDYVALGHIHREASKEIGGLSFAYPGSARVWRRGEGGRHGAFRVALPEAPGGKARTEFLQLESAGEYRPFDLLLEADGSLPVKRIEAILSEAGPADWVELRLSGLAAGEPELFAAESDFMASHGGRARILDISHEGAIFLGEDAGSEAVAAYRAAWERLSPAADGAVAARALYVGLDMIGKALQGRRA